jgi:hypothetical protein
MLDAGVAAALTILGAPDARLDTGLEYLTGHDEFLHGGRNELRSQESRLFIPDVKRFRQSARHHVLGSQIVR